MAALTNQTITTALTASVSAPLQITSRPESLAIFVNFVYGSGGSTFSSWVQTSHDGGQTWMDIANVTGTTASLTKIYNLSASTVVTTAATPGDGALASNTTVDGLLGTLYRCKTTTTGTYGGNTTLSVYAVPRGAGLTAS